MVNVEPFDGQDDPCRRWNIAGYGVFYEKDLVSALKRYYKQEGREIEAQTWLIRSENYPGTTYLVTLKNGIFSCTCRDFKFRAEECKHIRKVKKRIAGEKQKNKLPGIIT